MESIISGGGGGSAQAEINEAKAGYDTLKEKLDGMIIEAGGGVQNFRGWGYQDFAAGVIDSTSVTLTANENGTDVTFDAAKIINNTAVIVLASDGDKVPYSGITKLFSTRVEVSSNTGAAVTLNAVPRSSYGDCRIYYYYSYTAGIPENYSIAPKSVSGSLFAELDANFATDEELTAAIAGLSGIPTGGSTLQVLAKTSGDDGDATWYTLTGGGISLGVVNGLASVNNGAYLDMQPAEGQEWEIHNISYANAMELYFYDGSNLLKSDSDSAAGGKLGLKLHCTNTKYYRLKNVSGGAAALMGYDGVRTL